MRAQRFTVFGGLVAAISLSMAALGPACGGDKPTPKVPGTATDAAPGTQVQDDAGQVVGTVAAPEETAGLSDDAKASYQRGSTAFKAGDLQAAKSAFSEAANKSPKVAAPHFSLGTVLERLGDAAGAQAEYEKAYNVDPNSEGAMGAYALCLARNGKGNLAETFLNLQHQKFPEMVRVTIYFAEVKSINGDSTSAQTLAQEALKKQPDNVDAMMVIARDYFRTRKYDVSLYALAAILDGSKDSPARDKENAEAKLLRGLIRRELGDRRLALQDFDEATKKRPDLFEGYIGAGEMKLEAGNAQEALDPLEKAVRYAPNSAVAHLDLGDCYRVLSRADAAKREFDTALAQDSSLAGVHYDLGLLYLYSTGVPGVGGEEAQVAQAIKELELFKTMRGARPPRGQGDDVDELLSTAKRKQEELKAKNAPPPPPPPPTPAATGDAGAGH